MPFIFNANDVPESHLVRVVHDEHVVAAPVVLVFTVGYEHVAKHSFKVFGVRLRIVNVRRVVTFFEHVFFVSNVANAGPCFSERHFCQYVDADPVAEIGAAVTKT